MVKFRWLIVLTLVSGCSSLPFLGGGTGVSVTPIGTQVAKEATQQVVAQQERTTAGRDVIKTETVKEVEAEQVGSVSIQNIPPWVMLLLILGWLLPSPQEIGRGFYSFVTFFRQGKNQENRDDYTRRNTRVGKEPPISGQDRAT